MVAAAWLWVAVLNEGPSPSQFVHRELAMTPYVAGSGPRDKPRTCEEGFHWCICQCGLWRPTKYHQGRKAGEAVNWQPFINQIETRPLLASVESYSHKMSILPSPLKSLVPLKCQFVSLGVPT
jgi:hypothetical protein